MRDDIFGSIARFRDELESNGLFVTTVYNPYVRMYDAYGDSSFNANWWDFLRENYESFRPAFGSYAQLHEFVSGETPEVVEIRPKVEQKEEIACRHAFFKRQISKIPKGPQFTIKEYRRHINDELNYNTLRRQFQIAVAKGELVRVRKGVYAIP